MRLVMVGMDYTTAGVADREVFSLDRDAVVAILPRLVGGEVSGCVLLSTCNRAELYLSHHGDVPPDGVSLLCRALGRPDREYRRHFVERAERQAATHLMRVAAGMQSGVPGDGQIVSQVRTAVETARKAGSADPLLEALFRSAVTAGKRVRTEVRFAPDGASVAAEAAATIVSRLAPAAGKRVLVIGNGVVATAAAASLAAAGCRVTVTYRAHRGAPALLPAGCAAVPFEERYDALAGHDAVLSATTSPHRTIEMAALPAARLPGLFVDLAVPRDIDPALAAEPGVSLLNIDGIRPAEARRTAECLASAEEIIAAEAGRFDEWRRSHRRYTSVRPGEADFPLFVNLHGATVLMAGGGKVAARRSEKLLAFGARVRLVSPAISADVQRLLGRDGFDWRRETYRPEHLDGVTLAIAATDDREVNRRVGEDARARGILVSVADKRSECSFYFPAIVRSDCFTAGLVSNHGDHRSVRRAADRLRKELESIDEDCAYRQP